MRLWSDSAPGHRGSRYRVCESHRLSDQERYVAYQPRPITNRLGLDDDLLDRVFSARGITELTQLEKGLTNLLSPADLPEIDQAALRLDAIEGVLIVGDFDADGATSVALCLLALGAMGARHVEFLVPNRFDYGWGRRKLAQLAAGMQPRVIVTVDKASPALTASPWPMS